MLKYGQIFINESSDLCSEPYMQNSLDSLNNVVDSSQNFCGYNDCSNTTLTTRNISPTPATNYANISVYRCSDDRNLFFSDLNASFSENCNEMGENIII